MNEWKFRKRIISIYIILILIITGFIGILLFNESMKDGGVEAATIIVDWNGGGDYKKIQDAINAAKAGDSIYVWAGIYYENIIVDKNITLIGNGMANTTINGSGNSNVVEITADWVNITGFTIINNGENTGIRVSYSDHCKIQDCNFSNNSDGIYLYYSHYTTLNNNNFNWIKLGHSNYNIINNNTCNSNNYRGIYLSYSSNNTIKNNNCSSNKFDGIELFRSSYNEVKNNKCLDNYNGIELRYSSHNTILNNTMSACGLYIFGLNLHHWNTHTISSNNTVNGKPLYYWKNINNGVIPSGAGQIILANCTNITIENQKTINTRVGIVLVFSSNNILKHNNCSNNQDGIYLFYSSNNMIVNNTCSKNRYGIYLEHSSYNTIDNNTCNFNNPSNRPNYGIYLYYSNSNTIVNNNCSNNIEGISLDNSDLNIINNNICLNDCYGIFLEFSKSNSVINNSCFTNRYRGISISCSDSNIIKNNNISKNGNGITFDLSVNNIFFENYISYNSNFGISIDGNCKNNFIFHNNIVSNKNQSFDRSWYTYWNNSQHEGNYWSDYNGSDVGNMTYIWDKTGKHLIAGDGIGDTNVPWFEMDLYPFIMPYGWLYPGKPILLSPGDKDADGNYTLFWNKTRATEGYILEEANNEKFKSSLILYNGTKNIFNITGRKEGTYFYRIKAYNNNFESDWSNYVKIKVIYPPNLPPKINRSIDNITMFEDTSVIGLIDLHDWFIDPNEDDLTFKVKDAKNITVDILDNGSVMLSPIKDWNGNETLVFIANDSIQEISDTVNITVVGINDQPEEPIISTPQDGESFESSIKINFSGTCFDVDEIYGDILNYSWTSNISGIIGFNKEIENMTLPLGYHNIILKVTDLMNESNQTNITIILYCNKNNITNNFTDTDNDMIPDYWERKYGLNITNSSDADLDFDKDNLTNLEEYLNHTDPFNPDTDNDTYNDGLEVDKGTDPLDDEDYPSDEDNDKGKKNNKIEYTLYAVLFGIIIIILILLILYVNLNKKKERNNK